MVKFMSFSSGSCGNCYYLGTEEKGLLIDAGVSFTRLKKCLGEAGLSVESFGSILLTHDHFDHIRSIGKYCSKLSMPVYTTETIHNAVARHGFTEVSACRRVLEEGKWNDIDGFKVRYFVVPHDATQTVGYAIVIEDRRFVVMTDIGKMTDEAVTFARQADTVVIESNYDMDMLMGGRYTYDLKMRIVRGHGHLSNDECADAIRRFIHPGLRNIFLCHLSENNNTPRLAYDCSMSVLRESGLQVCLRCLPRRTPSPLFIL